MHSALDVNALTALLNCHRNGCIQDEDSALGAAVNPKSGPFVTITGAVWERMCKK